MVCPSTACHAIFLDVPWPPATLVEVHWKLVRLNDGGLEDGGRSAGVWLVSVMISERVRERDRNTMGVSKERARER